MPRLPLLLLLPALLLGSCATPASAPAAGVSQPAETPLTGSLVVTLFVPSAPVMAARVRPQYVGPATTSLRVQLGAFDQTLSLGGTACSDAPGGRLCTLSLRVAPGADQLLTVSAYGAGGQLLSRASQRVTVNVGQDSALNLVLQGVAASALITPTGRADDVTATASTLTLDLGGPYELGVALRDAADQLILDPGRPTEALLSSNPAFTVTAAGAGRFTLGAPDPAGADQTTVLTVRDAGGTVLASQSVTVPAQKLRLSLSTAAPVAGSSVLALAQLTSARGRPLGVAGRAVTFSTTDGSVPNPSVTTDATGAASTNVVTGPGSGTSGTVTASSGGVSAGAAYTSVAGTVNSATSTVTLSPGAVKVGGQSTLTVTLKDTNGNPMTTPPTVTVSGAASVGAGTANGNVFTYPVAAGPVPRPSTFTVQVGGVTVGSATLAVSAYPITVSDGGAALTSSSTQYDFQDGAPHRFAVAETNYAGPFAAASSNGAVATAGVSGGVLTVTPGQTAGFSTITLTDTNGQTFTFTVSVTTVNLTVR